MTLGSGETILQCPNGEEALDLLGNMKNSQSRLPDILLLDINMPRMNGLELLKAIRSDEHFRHLPVYILTTSDDEEDRKTAFQWNVAGYFLKGLDMGAQEKLMSVLNVYWEMNRIPD